jgi:hypothetical protein
MTHGIELIEVSGNARRRLLRKAAAVAWRGSSLVGWLAMVEELITLKGIYIF